jgi:choice-of-anchor B domain-containing protein
MKIRITFLVLLITGIAKSQTLCTNGFAGIYPCNNVDLLSVMNFTQIGGTNSTDGNDCWGWTDPLNNKEYAIMGCTTHTAFVDVTNPTNPIYLGKVVSHNNTSSIWRDIKVYNNFAFIVSEGSGHGMQVFDLTRLRGVTTPQTFLPDARYGGFGNCHNIAINEATGFAYCIGTNTFNGGPHVVNIQNPLNPVFSFGYNSQGYTHDAQIVNYTGLDTEHVGKEIYFGCNEDKVVVIDVTNKSNPILLSTFFYSNIAYTHQGWLTSNQKYYIIGDELDELDFGLYTRSVVIDMSDLDNPVLKFDYIGTTPAIDHNGYTTANNKFHLANYRAGYRVMDTSLIDAGQMNEVGFLDTFPTSNSAQYNGAWSVYPYFASGTILVSDIDRGLFMVRLNPALSTVDLQVSQFTISPNPARTEVLITSESTIENIEIIDTLGKIIVTQNGIFQTNFTVDVSVLQKGLYFIKFNNSSVQKLVIE